MIIFQQGSDLITFNAKYLLGFLLLLPFSSKLNSVIQNLNKGTVIL